MNAGTAKIFAPYEENIQALGMHLRAFLLENLQDIIEQPDEAARIIGFSYGPGYKNMICTIIPSKKGMKLGFYKGSELPNPEKLLTGTGKVHRHVVINTTKDISHPALKKLLKAAVKAWEQRKALP